jgi:DNA mismatch endonuclease (patch repair protein)
VTKTREQISYNMSRVKNSGSEIEQTLGKVLWAAGIRYRKQYKKLPGKPDYVIVRSRIAIFCDSSFWHGRNWKTAKTAIKTNRVFWISKIERNIDRDREVNKMLRRLGWKVLRFWDFTIELHPEKCVQAVLSEINNRASKIFI